MTTNLGTPELYIQSLPSERQGAMATLLGLARAALVPAFSESMNKVGIGYDVPLSVFPQGYHCTPGEALPFITIASQARHIAVYHLGLYLEPDLVGWFTSRYQAEVTSKLDIGKSCIRFGNPQKIPFELLGELFQRADREQFIAAYVASRSK